MKKSGFVFISILLLSFSFIFPDSKITRGPAVGEIYYIGPTATGEGIYHSTDFGQTATCMDSTLNTNILFMSIAADITPGVLYGFSMPENLYISYDYGQEGSWNFRTSNINYKLFSGVTEGFLYNGFWQHSEDYGSNFFQHSYNGYMGNFSSSEIDNTQNIGYIKSHSTTNIDTIFFFISYDNFENLELQNVFNRSEEPIGNITRGFYSGELYTVGGYCAELRYSNDYGYSWEYKNSLYFNNVTDAGIVGGKQPGEVYIFKSYTQLMGEIKHTYIYHSLDYGETFEIYHPFSHGPDPYYANFEATPLEGSVPLTVQFTDLSSGDNIQTWEWDFNLDGTIDSYEQNPEYTFQDTGYYSIKLKISFDVIEDEIVRKYYIHVTEGNPANNNVVQNADIQLSNYPNPFNPSTEISFQTKEFSGEAQIEIYNLKGQIVKVIFPSSCHPEFIEGREDIKVTWSGTDQNNNPVSSGIYLYKVNIENSPVNKMLLLK